MAFALFVTAVVFGVATISNNNLQDLKTGELVAATPWRQQVALVLGVISAPSSFRPCSICSTPRSPSRGRPARSNALAAPQAALISAIAQGLLNGNFDWGLIGIGAAIGVVVIIVDEVFVDRNAANFHRSRSEWESICQWLYPSIPFGALLGWLYDRWAAGGRNPEFAQRMGVLLATGLIVGESIMGVVYAGTVAATRTRRCTGRGEPLGGADRDRSLPRPRLGLLRLD